jgi:hypothetical protein
MILFLSEYIHYTSTSTVESLTKWLTRPPSRYIYLGPSIEDGLFAWIQIGINGSADYTDDDYYGIAAYLTEDGGVSTGYTVGGGDAGGDAGGNGTAPTGTFSGSMPTGTATA